MTNLKDYPYKITLKKWNGRDGKYFIAKVPELLGCISEGVTIKEAIRNIKEAMIGYIEVKLEFEDELPKPLNTDQIVEIQGEYSDEEKQECFAAVRKMKAMLREMDH